MTAFLRCAKGHQWSDPSASDATTSDVSNRCPVCGGLPLADKVVSLADAKTKEMTLGDDSQLANPSEMTNVSVDDKSNASDKTAPTIAAAAANDDSETALAAGLSSEPADAGGTLPLSPSEDDALDRTEGGDEGADQASDRTEEDKGNVAVRDNTMGQTEATALGKPTAGRGNPAPTAGKRAAGGPTTIRRGKAAKLPSKIAGYEILGELGRGGMGVVYKARQAGLNRICALKMILGGGLASADAISRFKIEAEAIAHLQHPNIVQVYEIGKAEDCPYFSLEFVEGSNLQAKIAGTPQPPQETARMMQQICEGVHAAHQRGVLHRDLKPANILLTKDNMPKITDFGLAKRLEEKDHGQTRTGAILGTPSYMAPEQAMGRAKDVGPAADVYSLGAVLYDMLTGRPPFRGETVMDTLNQVQKMEPLAPRNLAPKVPLDLQTICLKALQKDPKKRYATAGEMAEDLRRFQSGEPIQARPTPAWERGVKWAKRRPALATAISVSTVAMVSVLTFGILWLNTARVAASDRADAASAKTLAAEANEKAATEKADAAKELARVKSQALEEEKELKRQADLHYAQGRKLAENTMNRVNRSEFRYEPGMEFFRRDIAKQALEFYKDFLIDRGKDPSLRVETADSDIRLAHIYRDLSRYDDALFHYQEAWKQYAELEREKPGNEAYRLGVAAATMERAFTWQLQGKLSDSEKGYRDALDHYGQLAKDFPKTPLYRDDMASIWDNLGTMHVNQGRLQDAESNFDEALRLRNALAAEGNTDFEPRKRLARLQGNRAALLVKVGKLKEAEKSLVASRDLAKSLANEKPEVPDYAQDWAERSMNLAIYYRDMNQPQLAVDALREAIGLLEGLKTDYPRTSVFRQQFARANYELGNLYFVQGKPDEAQDQYVIALQLQEQLLAKDPQQAVYRLQLAQTSINLGMALAQLNDLDKARDHYRKGVELLEKAKPVASSAPDVCDELARGYQNLAYLSPRLNPPLNADPSWDRVLALRQELAKAFPESLDKQRELATTYVLFATRYQKADKKPEAVSCFKDAAATLAACVLLIEKDSSRSDQDRKALMKDYGDNTLLALRRAVELGFNDANYLKTAPEFRLLRERPEFQQLVSQLEKK